MTTTLAKILLAPERRELIAADVARSIEAYVRQLHGLKGFALGAGLKAVTAVRHDALSKGIEGLLPDFASALEPLFQRCCASEEKNFGRFIGAHAEEAVAAIMGTIDARAASGAHAMLAPVYRRLRGTIEGELRRTLPRLVDRIGEVATANPPVRGK